MQPGFGRVGSHWWGHDRIGVQPDVVTIGKPMANGHPVAAVVAKSEITSAFQEAFGYFNTFGGNPVSCAAAMAVMDVLEDENLVSNAHDTGAYALGRMRELTHAMVGEVRGAGLFLGMEFVGENLEPAPEFTRQVVEGSARP